MRNPGRRKPCVWQARLRHSHGPIISAEDDDHHQYYRGVPFGNLLKTLHVLTQNAYRPYFYDPPPKLAGGRGRGRSVAHLKDLLLIPRHPIANPHDPRECAAVLKAKGDRNARLRILESLLLGESVSPTSRTSSVTAATSPITLRSGMYEGTDTRQTRSVIE